MTEDSDPEAPPAMGGRLFQSLFSYATKSWTQGPSNQVEEETPGAQRIPEADDSSIGSSKDCCDDQDRKETDAPRNNEQKANISTTVGGGCPSTDEPDDRNNGDGEDPLDCDFSCPLNLSPTTQIENIDVAANKTNLTTISSAHFLTSEREILSSKPSRRVNHSVDLQRPSWKIADIEPSESRSPSGSLEKLEGSGNVFVKDDKFCWLPAKVLKYNADHALVAVTLPSKWDQSTVLGHGVGIETNIHSSMKKLTSRQVDRLASEFNVPSGMLRKAYYSEYDGGYFPKQNTQSGRHIDVEFSGGEVSSDLADLKELHMAAILYNLKERHFIQKPYTRVGDILIAMNPFVWIDGLYTDENRNVYSQNLIWSSTKNKEVEASNLGGSRNLYDKLGFDPHIYEVSSLAYRDIAITGKNQTIIVTGESGAGKTETVKILIDHLASAQFSRPGNNCDREDSSNGIVSRVVQSSPVFEAFGNAKTARNDNSSRFGKFIRLQFKVEPGKDEEIPCTELVGSKVSTYLLEKNRVVFHSPGERTFHIFYQLLAAPCSFKQKLWSFFDGTTVHDFMYTAGSACIKIDDELESWTQTQKALQVFKIENDSLLVLMRALAVVLQLGNLIFEHDTSSEFEHATSISSRDVLERLSEMMGIDSDDLQKTMTSRTLKTPNADPIQVQLTPEAAKETCDALAKEIYARVFDVVVRKVNEHSLSEKEISNSGMIGQIALLDIFGFEHFELNRFEQLCINYCNEKLQGKYVLDNFNEIKNIYIEEGVDLYDFKLIDNSDVLRLLESKRGLIQLLNEECLVPKGNDESYVHKVKKTHLGPSSKLVGDKLHKRTEFGIKHFAGCVCYDAHDFVRNNMDKLPHDLINCAARSTNVLIQQELRRLLEPNASANDFENNSTKKRKDETKKTVVTKFQFQLRELMSTMEGTKTRYIRCIKPNKSMIPKITDHMITTRQMECSGLMTALTISKESYPQNLDYEFIMTRYACLLLDDEIVKVIADLELREKVTHVLTQWLQSMTRKNTDGSRKLPFACGKTKVFLKAGAQDELEYLRRQYFDRSACLIQSWLRMIAALRLRSQKKKATYIIQSFGRMALERSHFCQRRSSATIICAWIRCCFAIATLRRKRGSTILIQSAYRRWRTHTTFLTMKKEVTVLQSFGRMALARSHLCRRRSSATIISAWTRCCFAVAALRRKRGSMVLIQSAYRRWRSRTTFLAMKKEVTVLQSIVRMFLVSLRQERQNCAATTINSCVRSYVSRAVFKQMLKISQQKTSRENSKAPSCSTSTETPTLAHSIPSLIEGNPTTQYNEQATLRTIGTQTVEVHTEFSSLGSVVMEETLVEKLKGQIAELGETNNGLTKEIFKLRHDKERMCEQHRSTLLQMSSKNSVLEEVIESNNRMHEKQREKNKRKMKEQISLLKEKQTSKIKRLRDELEKTRESHQEYLVKLMDVLETTHHMREEETAKLGREFKAIKKEKDNQILALQKEVRALRISKGKGNTWESFPFLDARLGREESCSREREEETRN